MSQVESFGMPNSLGDLLIFVLDGWEGPR
jgi:hypothetical protein